MHGYASIFGYDAARTLHLLVGLKLWLKTNQGDYKSKSFQPTILYLGLR